MNDLNVSWLGHLLSASAIFGTLYGWFPGIAAFVAFTFYCIQIYESHTFKTWRMRRRDARVERLRAALRRLENRD